MAKNTVFIVVVAILAIHELIFSNVASGLPVPDNDESRSSNLMDLETSANTILFRPMFLYRIQQRRIREKVAKLKKQRAEPTKAGNQLK